MRYCKDNKIQLNVQRLKRINVSEGQLLVVGELQACCYYPGFLSNFSSNSNKGDRQVQQNESRDYANATIDLYEINRYSNKTSRKPI